MSATNTNKQPVFVDRPLISRVRITNQIVGTATDLNVQGGQSPGILVDMDATLSSDNNSGGIIDSIRITRNDTNYTVDPDYVVNAATSGTTIGLVSGQIVYVEDANVVASGNVPSGVAYYTYTGATATGLINTAADYTLTGLFTRSSVESGTLPAVTFVVYHTRGTTVPIPADGDYHVLFAKNLGVGETSVDCSDVMPELSVPVPQQGNTAGLGSGTPLKARAINLQRGDRLYIGVLQKGVYSSTSGFIPGAHIVAQGGFY
ncbi:MAG TPA: hypothetical protein DEG32_04720 [Balneolaceae bacterium]|nr:hypothetical protein [Balneolaceae bacterium]|tara:strand:- start:3389 stop:4171 length:783 start_codon:yes stop_codon:yes gene_type:complete